jgi:hypothetical protein
MCYFWENYNTPNTGIEKAQYRYFGIEKNGRYTGIPVFGIPVLQSLGIGMMYRDTF